MESYLFTQTELKGKKCPKCQRKGLHLASHAHAFGYKDSKRAECRFCKAIFRKKQHGPINLNNPTMAAPAQENKGE